ncbi:MAG: glucan biosynthesis protein, partial [Methylocystis sp.]|nr:glucan biosynthesis protein [Methylocystis sp.]
MRAAFGAVAAGASTDRALAQAQPPAKPATVANAAFSRDLVVVLAQALAAKPYAAPAGDLPEPFASLTYEQFVGIKTRPGSAIW